MPTTRHPLASTGLTCPPSNGTTRLQVTRWRQPNPARSHRSDGHTGKRARDERRQGQARGSALARGRLDPGGTQRRRCHAAEVSERSRAGGGLSAHGCGCVQAPGPGGTQPGQIALLERFRAAIRASERVMTAKVLRLPGMPRQPRDAPPAPSGSIRMDYAATRSLDWVRSVRLLTSGLARVPSTSAPFRGAT
jgi:hypothetical protein